MFLVVALAVIGVPAWAVVNVIATVEQAIIDGSPVDTDTIVISYENTEPNAVRAFAVDITLSPPGGDPCATPKFVGYEQVSTDYWVYPGSIDINEAGLVDDVGTPIADPCILPSDTLGGLDTNGVTIEMGSLYIGAPNAPATSGVLIKLVVDDNCNFALGGNTSRGEVVMEGVGSKATTNYIIPEPMLWIYTHTDIAQWRYVGRPKCWCRFKGGRQCRGDVDNATEAYGKGWVPVGLVDYGLMTDSATWLKPLGSPGLNICADVDHLQEAYGKGFVRVGLVDYAVMTDPNNWLNPAVPADCP